ncbi:MAG TPA: hypothetical protein VFW49_14755 [Fluviicoccus sp.]|nr:hypothetical protein [Fluviicoccus sp.]
MNWGGFAGGLAAGFANGVSMGKVIGDAMKQKKINDVREQGIAEAQAARSAAVDAQIQDNSQAQTPAATGGITGKPAEQVTAPSGQPTESMVENPERTPGATVTPAAAPTKFTSVQPKLQDEDRSITIQRAKTEPARMTADAPAPGTAAPVAGPQAGLPFMVGGKGYATREEARAAAEKATPDVMSFMSKTLVPRMQQVYMEQGDIEKADAWGKWAEDRENKAAMREWAGAYRAAQIGNFDKAADHIFELYKRYDDGITPLSKEKVTDNQGNVTGFNVRLKNDKTGEEYTQFIDKRNLTEMGLAALSPQAMFEQTFKRQTAADEAALKAAAEAAKDNRNFQQDIYKQDRNFGQQRTLKQMDVQAQEARDVRQQNNAIELKTIESQLQDANASSKVQREVGAKVQALRNAGYSDEFINGALPAILGVGDYKKATSPEEARRLAFSDRMKSDPMFGRKSAEEQNRIIDQDMKIVFGGGAATQTPRTQAPSTPAAPSRRGTPVYDPATGTIVYR